MVSDSVEHAYRGGQDNRVADPVVVIKLEERIGAAGRRMETAGDAAEPAIDLRPPLCDACFRWAGHDGRTF